MCVLKAMPYRHGFNLVEAAIVLGVVGLIIGGIWVAAASVTENSRENELANTVLSMAPRLAKLSSDQGAASSTNINSTVIQLAIPPANWVRGGGIYDPWGGTVHFYVDATQAGIHFQSLRQRACLQLLSRLSGALRGSSMINYIAVYDSAGASTGYSWPNMPVPANCPNTTQLVMVYFRAIR